MASKNKKNKAKNSYIYNGGEKNDGSHCKRLYYFTKQDRIKIKKECENNYDELKETKEYEVFD